LSVFFVYIGSAASASYAEVLNAGDLLQWSGRQATVLVLRHLKDWKVCFALEAESLSLVLGLECEVSFLIIGVSLGIGLEWSWKWKLFLLPGWSKPGLDRFLYIFLTPAHAWYVLRCTLSVLSQLASHVCGRSHWWI